MDSVYACGGYPLRYPNEVNRGVTEHEQIDHMSYLKNVLEGQHPPTSNPSADDVAIFKKLKTYYSTCMNTEAIKKTTDSLETITDHIKTLFPVSRDELWSNVTCSPSDYPQLVDLQVYLNDLQIDLFVSYEVPILDAKPENIVPRVKSSVWTQKMGYQDATFRTLSEQLNKYFSPDGHLSQKVIKDAMALGASIEKIVSTKINAIPNDHATSINETNALVPLLSIPDVLGKLAPAGHELSQVMIDTYEMSALSRLLMAAPKSVVQAYALLRTIENIAWITHVSDKNQDRWGAYCYTHVTQTLPWAASKFYIEAYLNPDSTHPILEIVEDVMSTLIERLDHVEWMTDATKALAKDKAKLMKANLLHPSESPNVINGTDLVAYYRDLEFGPSHFDNVLATLRWENRRHWNRLVQPTTPVDWAFAAYETNAYYNPFNNQFYITAGIVQEPFFGASLPKYVNYGTLGVLASHEMTHAFDPTGLLLDGHGVLTTDALRWDDETLTAYDKRLSCLRDQFNKYELHEDTPNPGRVVVNPKTSKPFRIDKARTNRENCADNGAVANSYAAWTKHKDREPEKNQKLPHLEHFSAEQLFFVSAAQIFCHNHNAEGILRFANDAHAPDEARIRAMAENSKEFRNAFHCKNKEPVCRVW
ncbi:hypothetical protein PFICI_00702 [Pestalotiopsis fici W106-1]|uniref:Peptidase M13 C-terminal domain-containing protein n=1 Tax=Pestalotiopsis fici (strain W106-1 / CGMCC3.15140) TaxID=1229662 RepID=W3XLJ9_PESFW|nr:uncharacterized protein PFICI_00702 [Pestalotiopsis fici W106-1]ETS86874.1 hypothetical protein PFICI_00702 [Pestalotiopsis fici W106-1]